MSEIIKRARETLEIEIAGIERLKESIDSGFEEAISMLYSCKGKVILSGIGKSGLIAQKIAATLTSTGTPSLFLHAGESSHGDLGIISHQDIVIVFSYSGETSEVIQLMGHLQATGIPSIAVTGKSDSTIARSSSVHLSIDVDREACPLGLTPTTSSTVTLCLGDALAMCLLEKREFRQDDFAKFHPGGSLGRKLTIRIEDVMMAGDDLPLVNEEKSMREAMSVLSKKNLGIIVSIEKNGKIKGVFTTGDLMRLIEDGKAFLEKPLSNFATSDPKTIGRKELAAKGLNIMEKHSITCLIVADSENYPIGIVQIYYILRAGVY
tara:strand:+ start:2195 stop:3160 length:966 start_codon:yes stop_codon:yes gene_type:complete